MEAYRHLHLYVKDTNKGIIANRQIFNELHNILFCILEQAVLAAETGHIAALNGRFHGRYAHGNEEHRPTLLRIRKHGRLQIFNKQSQATKFIQ